MTRRPRRGIPASLAALALLAISVLAAIDAIQLLAGRPPLISYTRVTGDLHRLHWNGPIPAAAAGVLIFLGLIALLAAVVPGRPVVVALSPADPGVSGTGSAGTPGAGSAGPGATGPVPDAGVSRRGLRTMLGSAAASVDGVTSATLAVRRNTVAATVHTVGSTEGIADAARAALEQHLDQISPARRPALRVKATTRSMP